MLRSRENHPSGCIFHRYLLLLLIDLNFHIGIFHRGVADVDPLRELLFDFALLITALRAMVVMVSCPFPKGTVSAKVVVTKQMVAMVDRIFFIFSFF